MAKPPPPNWGADKVSEYLENVRNNQFATFVNKKTEMPWIIEVDSIFLRIAENLVNPKPIIPALLLLRSHSAYRAACNLALAGCSSEAFAVLRSSLEYAGYGLFIGDSDDLAKLWLHRHTSEDDMKKMKKTFLMVNVVENLEKRAKRIADIYKMLYQRSIDFGAHPNERAVSADLKMQEGPDGKEIRLEQVYLNEDGLTLSHILKSTAETGMCSLYIFGQLFEARYKLLGLFERMTALGNTLGYPKGTF